MAVLRPLTQAEIQAAQAQYNAVGQSATSAISSNKFVFFAAFDGTNNNRNNPAYAGDTQSTAVGSLFDQVQLANANNSNVAIGYYPGPGTPEAGGTIGRILPTQQMRANADRAYEQFTREASDWLAADPTRSPADITTAVTGFSRGGPTAVIFAQMLNERGLVVNGTVLLPPGQVPVDAMLLIDPVSTGYTGNLSIPGNVNPNNITVVRAWNEDRFQFEGDDHSNDWRVNTVIVTGNHGDAGAFYDRGLGGMALEAYTNFFNASGLPTAAVPANRTYDASQPVVLHSEGITSIGTQRWGEWNTPDLRETRSIAPPQNVLANDPRFQNATNSINQDGTTLRTITYRSGAVVKQLLDGDGNLVLSANAGEQLTLDTATGKYSVYNSATQATSSYDPATQVSSYGTPGTGTVSVNVQGDVVRITGGAGGGAYVVESVGADNYTTFTAAQDSNGDVVLKTVTSINGQPPVNAGLVNAALVDSNINAKDILLSQGRVTAIIEAGDASNPDGTLTELAAVTGRVDWWNDDRIGTLASDVVSLISALRSEKPLPIITAGLNLTSHTLADPAIAEVAAALSAVGSLKGLVDALEKGDLGRILIDGGGVARSAITIYRNSIQQQLISEFGSVAGARMAIDEGNALATEVVSQFDGAQALLESLGTALVVLNIINSLANGDIKGAVISAIAYFNPLIGAALVFLDFVLADTNDQFEANGGWLRDAGMENGYRHQVGQHDSGGGDAFNNVMDAMRVQTNTQVAEAALISGQPMGVIVERLPVVEFKRDVMFLKFQDPLTGADYYRTFDLRGNYLAPGRVERLVGADGNVQLSPYGADPQNPDWYNFRNPADSVPNNQAANADHFSNQATANMNGSREVK